MAVRTTYRSILAISAPIMVGSAAQNIIALTDSVFLYHYRELEFATVGIVSVFYLIISAIGFSFSRGGQILIARRLGGDRLQAVGRLFHSMVAFEFGLAILMFLFMVYACPPLFRWFIDDPAIADKALDYLAYRSLGVFFSYLGVSMVSFYSGIARTSFISVSTIALAACNIVLNYILIFGKLGMPTMGIAGAGLASSLAEAFAFFLFLVYMISDKRIRTTGVWKPRLPGLTYIRDIVRVGLPLVAQVVTGLGSWLVFFAIVENLGQRELSVTNVVRIVYLVLAIPVWGYSSGINTIVSNLIGRKKRQAVLPVIYKTAGISLFSTCLIALPVVLFPKVLLYPLLGGGDMSIIADSVPILRMLFLILIFFAIGSVYFNGLLGTGDTLNGLKLQAIVSVVYIIFVYLVINVLQMGLIWAWASELLYWILMHFLSWSYLKSMKWYNLRR